MPKTATNIACASPEGKDVLGDFREHRTDSALDCHLSLSVARMAEVQFKDRTVYAAGVALKTMGQQWATLNCLQNFTLGCADVRGPLDL